jgi:hypothetical protein
MKAKYLLLASAITGVLGMAPLAMALQAGTSDLNAPTPAADIASPATGTDFSFAPTQAEKPADTQTQATDNAVSDPDYLDAAPESPNIHGFANLTVLTHYATPRGLIVVDKGTVLQPIVGLVFPFGDVGPLKNLTFVGGIWNCITYIQNDPHVGPWNELDDFFSLSFDPITHLNANFTYVAFNSPTGAYSTEHNSDLYLSYDDSSFFGGNFGIHPYVDFWWAMAGNSTVVLGKNGSTGYAQPGIVPTYTFKEIPSYPITVKVPMYISVGPRDYWSYNGAPTGGTIGGGNIGLFNIGVDVGVPLSFIPTKYGFWHADVTCSYFDLINNALLDAGTIVSGNTRRDVVVGTFQIGVGF